MPSHLKGKEGPLPFNISTVYPEANDIADHYAGQAAARFKNPDEATPVFIVLCNTQQGNPKKTFIYDDESS